MGTTTRAKKKIGRKRPSFPSDIPQTDDVAVAVLTGGRPHLLKRTLDSLAVTTMDRIRRWHIIVLVNGADEDSLRTVREFSNQGPKTWVRMEARPGRVRPIGDAISDLMNLVQISGRRYTLHLEDDWACMYPPQTWLDRGAYALESDSSVGQVRLRWSREKVMSINMATGRRIRWAWAEDHAHSPNAHLTFNPNLMRTEDLEHIYPCGGELEAQSKFEALHRTVVQILPGAFRHLGDDASLRRRLGRGHG